MEVLSFTLSKELDDLGFLDEIYSDYCYNSGGFKGVVFDVGDYYETNGNSYILALTLGTAIDKLLPDNILGGELCLGKNKVYYREIRSTSKGKIITYNGIELEFIGKNLLDAVEQTIIFLLNNNLLKK